jgi:hypothetical protein
MRQFEQSGFQRMEHAAYSLDLVPCDFFLWVYMRKQLKGRSFVEEEELLLLPSELMSEIPPDIFCRSLPIGIEGYGSAFAIHWHTPSSPATWRAASGAYFWSRINYFFKFSCRIGPTPSRLSSHSSSPGRAWSS